VLENLSRELCVVTWAVNTREHRVVDLRHQTVQSVAKLVEQGLYVGEPHQRWIAFRRRRQIQIVRNQRTNVVTIDVRCASVGTHPCAATLGVARIHVCHEQAEMIAFFVLDVEVNYDRVPAFNGDFVKRHAEQAIRHFEGTRTDVLKVEIRFRFVLVDIEAIFADLLGIVPPVMRSERKLVANHGLHIDALFLGSFQAWAPNAQEEVLCTLRSLGHVVFKNVVSM